MSKNQKQQQKPPPPPQDGGGAVSDPIKYGDVFSSVSGELAGEKIAPVDAAMMQRAESKALGQTQRGGAASAMQSAAARNERSGFVAHGELGRIPAEEGVDVANSNVAGTNVVTESVAGQVVGQYATPTPEAPETVGARGVVPEITKITIGEALEAAAVAAGNKPMEVSDAAAIQSAEVRATGAGGPNRGGVGATAQSAADVNAILAPDEDKVKLSDVLTDATMKMSGDKGATGEDAKKVATAELRNAPEVTIHPGGVAAAISMAARINEQR